MRRQSPWKAATALAIALAGGVALPRPSSADPFTPPGVLSFDYIKDGTKVIEELDKVLKILNPNPIDGLSPKTSMTFAETSTQAILSLSGGNFGTPDTTQTFSVTGAYWNANFSVTQDAAAVVGFDSVAISGTLSHVKGPHGDDGLGAPLPFSLIFEYDNPANQIADATTHPGNGHRDDFTAGINGTFKNIVDPVFGLTLSSDITTWNFTATANHIPEPGALALGLSALLPAGIALRRRR